MTQATQRRHKRSTRNRKPGVRHRPSRLQQLHLHAAGSDVGAEHHWVAVPDDCDPQPVRRFATFTADLHALAGWLHQCEIETVVMASTGIYWIPLFELLETSGCDVKLVDPHHVRQGPGRQTDVQDCQWLQELHTYGLLRGAFRPDAQVCELRSDLRQRRLLITDAARAMQHMQKALAQMHVKLTEVVSDITGKTGLGIMRALLAGARAPQTLASWRDGRCKQEQATIAKALEGTWRPEQLFALQQAVEQYDFLHQQLTACETHIAACLQTFASKLDASAPSLQDAYTSRRRQKNAPAFDLRAYLYRMTGVDLTAIARIDAVTAWKVLSEMGLDMTRWPTAKHVASWLGLCPGTKISGGKRYRSRSKPTANRAAAALRFAAQTLAHSYSALGAYSRRMRARLGAPGAITAAAHKLARLIYSMLRYGTAYVDAGQQAYEQQYRDRALRHLERKAHAFG